MSELKVYSSALAEIDTIPDVLSCAHKESINGVNTLSFKMILTPDNTDWINDTNVIKKDSNYFDIAKYKKGHSAKGELTADVSCEHISYRLNDSDYDLETFTETGTPATIFAAILSGTPFSVGTMELTEPTTYSIQNAMSRRSMVIQFAEMIGGELLFEGFTISILTHRGSATPKDLMPDGNIEIMSKAVDKTTLDESGNPTVSYDCSLIQPMSLELGDSVTMYYSTLGIDVTLRIVSITKDPYNSETVEFSVSNVVPTIEDAAYRISTDKVSKDATYNGVRIGPVYGFEAIRNDKKARAYFRSDGMKFQSGDGSGASWKDRLYYEYDAEADETYLVFDGKLSADVIEAVTLLIAESFYADMGYIAGLTVDSLDTSEKLAKYLASDTSDVNYIKVEGHDLDFITASTDGSSTEQARNRSGHLLYWTDDSFDYLSTTESEYPAMQYVYTELTKLKLFFEYNGTNYIPKIVFGAGTGTGNNGKLFMFKDEGAFHIDYNSTTGTVWSIWIDDDGVHFDGVPEMIYETVTAIVGQVQIWVQSDTPTAAKDNDLFIDTDDHSRYDKQSVLGNATLTADGPEFVVCNGDLTITLPDLSAEGVIKIIGNAGTNVVKLSGTINGSASGMNLFPGETVKLITDGSGWRAL